MDLTEYRRRQQQAWLRANADRLRREFWERKRRDCGPEPIPRAEKEPE